MKNYSSAAHSDLRDEATEARARITVESDTSR